MQYALDILRPAEASFDNFVTGGNAAALAAMRGWAAGDSAFAQILLWGEPGSGRGHLLRAAARAAGGEFRAAGDELAGIEDARWIAIDRVEALGAAAQQRLFNACNRLREGLHIALSANAPPLQLSLREDLRSRLGAGLVFQLRPLDDAEKSAALRQLAAARGLPLGDEAIRYLLLHAPRDMRSLAALLEALDRLSLERKRAPGVALLRELLQTQEPADAPRLV